MHKTVPVMVWADVDEEIAPHVKLLNSIPGVRTYASCRGTIGGDGSNSYRAYVMAYIPRKAMPKVKKLFDIGERGRGWVYLHPKKEREGR